jgi:chromosome segregation ATPase
VSAAQKQFADLNDSNAAQIAALRNDIETHSSTAKYYESEFNRLHAEQDTVNKNAAAIANDLQRTKAGLDAASRDAGDAVRLRSELSSAKVELEQLRAADAKRTGDQAQSISANEAKLKKALEAAEADIVTLKADIDQRRKAENSHAEALAKLSAESEAKLKAAGEQASNRTVPGNGGELVRLQDEAAKLLAELENARTAGRAAAMEHHATKNDLLQVRSALEETTRIVAERHAELDKLKAKLAGMPSDLDNYRRFKDALDAANRIAAGLPEKT